jgi:hypothetical protein
MEKYTEKNFSSKLLERLHRDVNRISAEGTDPFQTLSAVLQAVRTALAELKAHIVKHPFKDRFEEIRFFKDIKPRFYALRIFYLEQYAIETGTPAGDTDSLKDFFKEELKAVQRFFRQACFYYQYYRLGATELDALFFVRGAEVQSVLVPEMPEPDPEFSTACDHLFSRIRAYELLQEYLLGKLRALDPAPAVPLKVKNELPELKWTGDKINLVEVIYALYFTGQLNNGNADIAQIIQFMEKHLQIDLSRSYRDFIDIRNRKVSSPTRYIDQMRESIHKRIDDDLALKKQKNRV